MKPRKRTDIGLVVCIVLIALMASVVSTPVLRSVRAEEADLEKQIGKAVLKLVEERLGARIAKLESDLEGRNKKIAELEAKLKELALAPKKAGPPSNAFLGLAHIELTADVREKVGTDGALVTQVLKGSPADKAGVKAGDVVLAVNGTSVTSANFQAVVRSLEPGAMANLSIVRDGEKLNSTAELADRGKFFATGSGKVAAEKKPIVLGVLLAERDSKLLVEEVDEGFTGSVIGLKKDDQVTHLNGREVSSLEAIASYLKEVREGDEFSLTFVRDGKTIAARAIGARGKEGAKLVASDGQASPAPAVRQPAFLGVEVVPESSGPAVATVVPGTAAASSGLKVGDVFKTASGRGVSNVEELKAVLAKLHAGDKLDLVVVRNGTDVEIKGVTLGAEEGTGTAQAKKPAVRQPGVIGIVGRQATGHVVVNAVTPGGPGDEAKLEKGDVILQANGKAVRSLDDLTAILRGAFAGDVVTLRLKRGDDEKDVKVTLGEAGA